MTAALAKGESVEIRGLCSFFVKEYDGYNEMNPKTGERVKINPRKLPFFKTDKEFKVAGGSLKFEDKICNILLTTMITQIS